MLRHEHESYLNPEARNGFDDRTGPRLIMDHFAYFIEAESIYYY